MSIGQRIKQFRVEKGLTQRQLGEILGSTQQMIAQYERGNHTPKLDTLNRIAEALDISLVELVGADTLSLADSVIDLFSDGSVKDLGDTSPDNPSENYLICKFRKLNNKGQKKVTDYAEDIGKIPEYIKEEQ